MHQGERGVMPQDKVEGQDPETAIRPTASGFRLLPPLTTRPSYTPPTWTTSRGTLPYWVMSTRSERPAEAAAPSSPSSTSSPPPASALPAPNQREGPGGVQPSRMHAHRLTHARTQTHARTPEGSLRDANPASPPKPALKAAPACSARTAPHHTPCQSPPTGQPVCRCCQGGPHHPARACPPTHPPTHSPVSPVMERLMRPAPLSTSTTRTRTVSPLSTKPVPPCGSQEVEGSKSGVNKKR